MLDPVDRMGAREAASVHPECTNVICIVPRIYVDEIVYGNYLTKIVGG